MRFSDYDIECIHHAKTIIDADISRHFTIEFIALKTGLGKTKLKKGFKEYFGLGLFAYLRKQRMLQAGELLAKTHKPIKEIARATGFRYASNFITAFTLYYGLTPAKYRNDVSSK